MNGRALSAAPSQARHEASACQESSELVKDAKYPPLDVDASTASNGIMQEPACLCRCHPASLLDESSGRLEDDAEALRRLLRRLVLPAARFCPKTGATPQTDRNSNTIGRPCRWA
mmetsp:Transcript_78229/g.155060  ORF Transcript_78229/g.155060 Transcript_78229/m.155060 type:complete len:115 (-) Transcript_78229:4-348(-)